MNTINEKFIIDLQGKSFVTYEGLLDLAHQNGLLSIDVQLLQVPSRENNMTAVCMATARTKDSSFTDIGDASPSSVASSLIPHIIRMASTRAKARALRDLTNIGMTAYEELSMPENKVNNIESEPQPPTPKQIETLKQLASQNNLNIDLSKLNKKTAGTLIGELFSKYNIK